MKFSDFKKNHKAFIVFVIIVVLFFFGLLMDNHLKLDRMKKDYENQIEELKKLVRVTDISKSSDKEFDIYQTTENFLKFYYGISENIAAGYRLERLQELMTEAAYIKHVTAEYDNSLEYSVFVSDVQIYVDYKNFNKEKAYVCVFYNENTDWPNINTITLKKYWIGALEYDVLAEQWKVSEIMDCQELLTREEFDAFITDTDVSTLENVESGGKDDEATEKKE